MRKTTTTYNDNTDCDMNFYDLCNTTERRDGRIEDRDSYLQFCEERISKKGCVMGIAV